MNLDSDVLRHRLYAAAFCVFVALVASTGLVERHLFSQSSSLRYALTVIAPLLALALVVSERPLRLSTAVLVLSAPFHFVITLHGLAVSPLGLCLCAVLLGAWLTSSAESVQPRSALRAGSTVALLLAAPSLARSHHLLLVAICLTTAIAVSMCVTRVARDGARRLLATVLVVTAAVQGALGSYEAIQGRPLNLYGIAGAGAFGSNYFYSYESSFRPSAAMPDPISLGNLLALACPLALCLALSARRRAEAAMFIAAGATIITGLAFTLSRMSWIAAAAGLLVALLLMPPRKAVVASLGLVVTAAACISFALTLGGEAVRHRFSSIFDPTAAHVSTQQGDLDRQHIWRAAREIFWAHPLQGIGFGNISDALLGLLPGVNDATHAHSVYLNVLAEAGILGALALLCIVAASIVDLRRGLLADRLLYAGLGGGGVALLIGWSTDYTVRLTPVLALVCILLSLIASAPAPLLGEHEPLLEAETPVLVGAA